MTIQGIILAAGLSSRMETSKLELPLGDKTVIEQTITSMHPFSDAIFLVCGKQIDSLRKLALPYPKIRILFNENFKQGMFTSVQKGVAAISADLFFLLPGDCPLVQQSTFSALLSASEKYPDNPVFIPCSNNRKGHPILLRKCLIDTILQAPADTTLRNILAIQETVLVEVEDEGVVRDIDTREDYEKVTKHKFKE